MDKEMKELSRQLKEFRTSKNITAYRVSKDGGITITQVTDIEKGESNYTVSTLQRYLKGCGLTMEIKDKGGQV